MKVGVNALHTSVIDNTQTVNNDNKIDSFSVKRNNVKTMKKSNNNSNNKKISNTKARRMNKRNINNSNNNNKDSNCFDAMDNATLTNCRKCKKRADNQFTIEAKK